MSWVRKTKVDVARAPAGLKTSSLILYCTGNIPGRTSSIFFAVLLQLQFASYIPSLARVAMEEPPVRVLSR